jgi:hypothetical protein
MFHSPFSICLIGAAAGILDLGVMVALAGGGARDSGCVGFIPLLVASRPPSRVRPATPGTRISGVAFATSDHTMEIDLRSIAVAAANEPNITQFHKSVKLLQKNKN